MVCINRRRRTGEHGRFKVARIVRVELAGKCRHEVGWARWTDHPQRRRNIRAPER